MYGHLMHIVQPRLEMTFKSVFFLCILGHCLESGAD